MLGEERFLSPYGISLPLALAQGAPICLLRARPGIQGFNISRPSLRAISLVGIRNGGGNGMIPEVAREISNRLIRIYRQNKEGLRPVFGGSQKFQTDSHWRNYILC